MINLSPMCQASQLFDHKILIENHVKNWKNECIAHLSPCNVITITDAMLLSYQIVEASLSMSKARLTIQHELLHIATLSINDTFDIGIQVQNNDFSRMKQAITTLEQAQEKIKRTCVDLKKIIPLMVNIDPLTIQMLIINFKTVILNWVKTQNTTMIHFEQVKQEFITAAHLFAHLNSIYHDITQTESIEHSQLLCGANSLSDTYKKIENTMSLLTAIRQESMAELEALLTLFFKMHYEVLYENILQYQNQNFQLHNQLQHPNTIFATIYN